MLWSSHMHKNPALLVPGHRKLLGFQSLEQRKAALAPFHRQFNPTQPPALPPLPQKSPLALGQQCLCSHTANAGEAQTKTKPLWGFGSVPFQPDQFTNTVPRVRAAQAQGNRDDKVISTHKRPSCKDAPPQEPQPVLAGEYPTCACTEHKTSLIIHTAKNKPSPRTQRKK